MEPDALKAWARPRHCKLINMNAFHILACPWPVSGRFITYLRALISTALCSQACWLEAALLLQKRLRWQRSCLMLKPDLLRSEPCIVHADEAGLQRWHCFIFDPCARKPLSYWDVNVWCVTASLMHTHLHKTLNSLLCMHFMCMIGEPAGCSTWHFGEVSHPSVALA